MTGLDPAEEMVVLAREQDADGRMTFEVGGAGAAQRRRAGDAIVALNVLAYLTDAEMDVFWAALGEILVPGRRAARLALERAVRRVRAQRRHRLTSSPRTSPTASP